jgi:hypothetical protein
MFATCPRFLNLWLRNVVTTFHVELKRTSLPKGIF